MREAMVGFGPLKLLLKEPKAQKKKLNCKKFLQFFKVLSSVGVSYFGDFYLGKVLHALAPLSPPASDWVEPMGMA